MFNLYKKEINYYLNNPIGYIIVVLFAIFANFLFVKDIFAVGSASLQPFFSFLPWLFLIFVPAVSMRIISEEKRTNTLEVLLTLSLNETQIVLAKFFALLTLTFLAVVLTFALPISLYFIAKIYLPEIIVGYLGAIFLASSFIAVSMFFSSLTKNQVVAFLSAAIVLFTILVLGSDFAASILPKFIIDFLSYLSPLYHFQNFAKGIVDLRSLIYFASLTAVGLFLTIISLERRG